MADITSDIGTASRDYSTYTAWEADIGVGLSTADNHTGEGYADSDFDESCTLNVDAGAVIASVASGERHTGTEGTGLRLLASAARVWQLSVPDTKGDATATYVIQWIEFDGNATSAYITTQGSSNGDVGSIRHCIFHGSTANAGHNNGLITASGRDVLAVRNLVYDCKRETANFYGFQLDGDTSAGGYFGNTVVDLDNGNGNTWGIFIHSDVSTSACKNNISGGHSAPGFSKSDFSFGGTNIDSDYNMSEDSSSDNGGGSNNLINQTYSTWFVSTTDYSPQDADAPQVDAGVDLGTTELGANIDLKGRDVDAQGDTWDMGVIEFVAAAASLVVDASRRQYQLLKQL